MTTYPILEWAKWKWIIRPSASSMSGMAKYTASHLKHQDAEENGSVQGQAEGDEGNWGQEAFIQSEGNQKDSAECDHAYDHR